MPAVDGLLGFAGKAFQKLLLVVKGPIVVFGPSVDRDTKHTWWADAYYSRGRTEIGCLVWGVLSLGFLVLGMVKGFPLWTWWVVLGGPMLLLLIASRVPLANIPIVFVVLASLGGIGWELAAADYPPWTIGLLFLIYVFSYEEGLSGLVKLRYLESVIGRRHDGMHRQRCDEDHVIAKRRIWGYMLATSSSAVVFSGFKSDGHYHLVLLILLVLTFLMRTRVFGTILCWFAITRPIGIAIGEDRRWPHVMMALVNAAAFGLSLHWLVVHGSAFGGHAVTGWSGPVSANGNWFGNLMTVANAALLWMVAAFRFEWTE